MKEKSFAEKWHGVFSVNKTRPTHETPNNYWPAFTAIQSGITLFELMAVVCIIGVVFSLGVISLKPLWQKHLMYQSISDIDSQLQVLRLKAILEDCTYQMKIDDQHLLYRKKIRDKWLTWNKYKLGEETRVFMSGNIYFDNKGFASPNSITIQLEQKHQKLIININGRTRRSEIF